MRKMVVNEYGVEVDFEVAVMYMRFARRFTTSLHRVQTRSFSMSTQSAMKRNSGEEWEFAKENPCY